MTSGGDMVLMPGDSINIIRSKVVISDGIGERVGLRNGIE